MAAKLPPSQRFTDGFGRSTILAALANAIALLIGVGAVLWESIQRWAKPSRWTVCRSSWSPDSASW